MQKHKSFWNFTKMASSALGPRLDLGSDVSSNYKDYDTIVNDISDSEDFGKPKKPDYKKLLIDQLKEDEFLEESRSFDENNNKNCKLPQDLIRKLKIYIFILSQKKREFLIEDLKTEFNDNFEIPDEVDAEDELWKLGR